MELVRVNVLLTRTQHEDLRREAYLRRVSRSDLVRRALARYMEEKTAQDEPQQDQS